MPNRYDKNPGRRESNSYTMKRGGGILDSGSGDAFNEITLERPSGSWFDLTHRVTLTGNMGKLIPVMIMEVYPGDKVKIDNELLIRLQPMVAPAMQRLDATVHHFFTPDRILWQLDAFEQFLRGEDIAVPFLELGAADTLPGSLADYLGIPQMTGVNILKVQATPFVAFQRVHYEYYRDQNLSIITDNDKPYCLNGDNAAQKSTLLAQKKRNYRNDYFTSALPFTQKGTAATVNLDFIDVPVKLDEPSGGGAVTVVTTDPVNDDFDVVRLESADIAGPDVLYAKTSNLSGTSFTINDFRLALATQHWLERMAVGGTRMTEIIRAHFGVTSSDQRLDRPEYIGGMKTPVIISEVLQTGETSAESPQGNMSGHGIAAAYQTEDAFYVVEEHGWILSILSVMPLATYANGIHRSLDWLARSARDEWYWPQFAALGEQAIANREIYSDLTQSQQEIDWGYTGRFNELRHLQSRIAGQLKTSLAHWTAARIFTNVPDLNDAFKTDVLADIAKMFVVEPSEDNHELIIDILNKVSAYRLLPKIPVPELKG